MLISDWAILAVQAMLQKARARFADSVKLGEKIRPKNKSGNRPEAASCAAEVEAPRRGPLYPDALHGMQPIG